MKKRLFSILLALCMVLCLVPTTAFARARRKNRLFAAVKQPARRKQ